MTQQLPTPTLQPFVRGLSDEQVRAIHYATLEILSQTGVEMQDPQGCELLLDAGAWESDALRQAQDKAASRYQRT